MTTRGSGRSETTRQRDDFATLNRSATIFDYLRCARAARILVSELRTEALLSFTCGRVEAGRFR